MAPRRSQIGGETNAQDLRVSLMSGNATTRGAALDDLIYFFRRIDSGNKVESQKDLNDKTYHVLFEGLFHATLTEKKNFLSGKSLKNVNASRLSKCAEALRITVTHGASRIKRKTARAVIDHITETLPGRDDEFLEPLAQDYIKAFVSLLAYPVNVEGLAVSDGEGWLLCVDFCLGALSCYSDTTDRDSGLLSRASPAPGTAQTLSGHSTGRSNTLLTPRSSGEARWTTIEALVRCLLALVSAPNAPFLKRSKQISNGVIQTLQRSQAPQQQSRQGKAIGLHQAAFATLNCILFQTIGDDLALGGSLAKELVPLLTHWWQPRSSVNNDAMSYVRDEMLRTIYGIHLYVASLSKDVTDGSVLSDVEELLEALWYEYAQRDDRSRLQLDDLTFSSLALPSDYFVTKLFALRPYHVAAERKWALIEVIAMLEGILRNASDNRRQSVEDQEQPRKKRRLAVKTSRLHQKLLSKDRGVKLGAIQVVPFLVTQSKPSSDDIDEIIDDLLTFISDKQGIESSWAMIACASCTVVQGMQDARMASKWRQIWHLAVRSVSIPSTSRAACVLLHSILESGLVSVNEVADDITNIVTAADISGPAILSDASLVFMLHLLHLRNSMLPSTSQKTSGHVVRWVFSKWNPADATFSSLHSIHVAAIDLVSLLRGCFGLPNFEVSGSAPIYGGPLSQARMAGRETDAMARYLLLLDGADREEIHRLPCSQSLGTEQVMKDVADASFHAAKKLVLDLFYPKFEGVAQIYESTSQRGEAAATHLSSERLHSLVTCLITGVILLPELETIDSTMSRDVGPALFNLVDTTIKSILDSPQAQEHLDLIRTSVAPYIPPIDAAGLDGFCKANSYLLRLFSRLSMALDERATRQSSGQTAGMMDVDDDEFVSQASQRTSATKAPSLPRHLLALSLSVEAFHLTTSLRLHFLATLHENIEQVGLLPAAFIDRLLSSSSEEFLLCRSFLQELLASDLQRSPDDASRFLETIGGIISATEFSTSEVALCICIDVIENFIPIWSEDASEVSDMVGDLYSHLFKTSLPNNTMSPKVQIFLARLLYRLLEVNSQYARSLGLPSCRSSLLSILQSGAMAVKFAIGVRLPRIFELFVLKTHDDIFIDILESLPTDPDVIEGLAFRMFVLAELACKCSTLLRRCVYHIFEAPGKIMHCAKYARRCLDTISRIRSLSSPQELFQLFAPQLLYTWLETDSIHDIPYEIFGYPSLDELLQQAQAEAAALMVMRNQEDAINDLAQRLRVNPVDMVQQGFSKVLAYSIAHDVSMAKNGHQTTGESRVRKLLGKTPYHDSIYMHFADIVANFFDLIDQEDPIEKYFRKDPALTYAADIMDAIKKFSHSNVNLPPNQQPMFRAKYLSTQILHLCSKTHLDVSDGISDIWTPALVVSVARRLVNTVHPALGPLHACSVVRKLRVLISMAGSRAITSYPLEMLLHSLRPFIQNVECADDALGMTRYLIASGSAHLLRYPSFLAGYSLSTLASLRVFMESSQASTTQETQFKATMSKAQQFHAWFSKYLSQYESADLKSERRKEAFKSIVQSAAHIRSSGNAEKGTSESNLLLEILKDGEQEDQLLNEPARNLVLGMLCSDFRIPESGREDIIDTDEDAFDHGGIIWKSCRAQDLSAEYLTWAGRVVGRSFASSGEIYLDALRESRLAHYQKITHGHGESEQGLVKLVETLTMGDDSFTAGLAESALRNVVTQAAVNQDSDLLLACQKSLPEPLFLSSDWNEYRIPPSDLPDDNVLDRHVYRPDALDDKAWSQNLAIHLAQSVKDQIVLTALLPILQHVRGFADQALPFIVHLVLLSQLDKQQVAKRSLSDSIRTWMESTSEDTKNNIELLINTILYLRTQPYPNEATIADRSHWLDISFSTAASAASRCGMFKVALLFAELAFSETSRASRRSSASRELEDSTDVLLRIFENIDDPDAYYGLDQTSSLSNVVARLEYEQDGGKSLAFRGAQFDSHIRARDSRSEQDGQALVKALSNLGLAGISHSLLQSQQNLEGSTTSLDSTYTTARRLEIWTLPTPQIDDNHAVTSYKVYQSIHKAMDLASARKAVHYGLSSTIKNLTRGNHNASSLRQYLGTLAALSELDDIVNASDSAELENLLSTFESRSKWMMSGRYGDVSHILSCRQTSLSMLSQKDVLWVKPKLTPAEARLMEVKAMLLSSGIYRFHHAAQESLNLSTSLTDLIEPSEVSGLALDAAIRIEAANSLWDYGEMIPSIRMLQGIDKDSSLKKQTVPVSRSDLLSKIAYQVSVARLESPDNIQKRYLEPALKELKGKSEGKEAGKVFHQFAMFCDEQLQNPDGLEDLARLQGLKRGKSDEVSQLKDLIANTRESQLRTKYAGHLAKAKQWLELDQQELKRVEQTRSEFVKLSLENYLLSLSASDEHNNDALRFTALWLERSGEDLTNEAVKRHLEKVPTRKLASLMNQLTSRLQDQSTLFQKLLINLVFRICVDHPYHGMYQIWSGIRTRANTKDEVAVLRQRATEKIAKQLEKTSSVAQIWQAIDRTSKYYHLLAVERGYKANQKMAIKDSAAGQTLMTCLLKYHIPPPTLQIELSPTCDYSKVPLISKLEPMMSIASGVSAPKIITAVGSNGERFKQLVKGGNDDLRQDAIMEQVFAAVSSLLKQHRATRQRNLGIRTYKVLPLTASSGLIEFVPDTIPLHEYLMPAHERYYPKDLKGSACRKEISQVQNKSIDSRVNTYRRVTQNFHPVMRYFFMENFPDPDEWYVKRLAYTRTTAAISMLGHILGLGDRHGHNILLDTKTGEVVHIDLGVAFEMGRVLPVPELVPFRLTRDIVDGMGITKTEGVFRRCCEFTLDALRDDTYSIMTILDVLRYDPLYSWSISPLRLAKLQDTRRTDDGDAGDEQSEIENRKVVNEPSEADRALEVVRKKLSKTLSVTATVNDLINQATDERNLAVLYSGWAAYA
ncbi:Serine/threonine-protein kinase Tel1 [Pleurostoma richardsiae]|uniref:Serine/threonine-protein kinase Tel1 n=1 Tax=Pleurostoma richardsiae TaxID=41990 RepID=A0AA38VVR4_9PEZI|nr:Serine/threonine-protein kinase Tel1 [Pleurostoma richardsiae]